MKKRYRIGEIAKLKNIDAQTLRYYDRLGIFSPEIIDESNNYRYYSIEQFMEVDKIKFYKLLGLSLEEIKGYRSNKDLDVAINNLYIQKEQMKVKIEKMQAVVEDIEKILAKIENNRQDNDSIGVKILGSIYGVMGDCNTVHDWYTFEQKLNEVASSYPNHSEVGHNHGLTMIYTNQYLVEQNSKHLAKIILPINKRFKNHKNVIEYKLGKCIVFYCKGEHDKMQPKFNEAVKYINSNNIKTKGTIIVTSIINSFIVNNKEEALREVIIPIM